MNTFVWYSKGTQDSGTILAGSMRDVTHGTTPTRDFKGVAVCFGAKPADVFKWENRNFRAIMNDPRKISELSNSKAKILEEIGRNGVNTVDTCALDDDCDYEEIERQLRGPGFYCCTERLTGAVKVTNQNEMQTAINKGLTVAVHSNFKSKNVNRVYVVNGKAVVSLTKSFEAGRVLVKMATGDNGKVCEDTLKKLQAWQKDGRIKLGEDEHTVEELVGPGDVGGMVSRVIEYLKTKAQMYCIEYVKVGEAVVITNIIFSPSLEVLSKGAISLIATQVQEWVKTNSKTFKDSLLKMINDSTEEEAETLLVAINKYANG